MRGARIVGSVILTIASWWGAAVPAAPYAYIPSEGNNPSLDSAFSVIDTATNTVVATVPAISLSNTGVAIHPAGTRAWMSDDGLIRVMDQATHAVIAAFRPGGSAGVVFDPSGAVAYVANLGSGVFVIDAATHATIATIPAGSRTRAVAVDAAGARLYVTNLNDDTVSVIDTATRSVIATIAVGDNPLDIALHPAGTFAFVTNGVAGTLSVIDTTTLAVVATVPMGDRPAAVDVDPAGTLAYVAIWGEDSVKVVDTGTRSVVDTIPLGSSCVPGGIDVHPAGARVYVTCVLGGDVRVIDTTSRAVVASIPVREFPRPWGRFIGPDIPGAPTIGAATPGDGKATVNFTAPVITGGSRITGYTATCNPGGFTATGTASPLSVAGLANGAPHSCSVAATNAVGTGTSSATANVTPIGVQAITFANPGPQAFGTSPTLPATASSSLAVTFTSATTGVCTITPGGTLTFVSTGTCTILADQAGSAAFLPAPQVSQTFAVNAALPGAPVIGAATAGNGEATVSFTAPGFTGGAPITGYTVTCNPGAIGATGPASPITMTGLANGTAYSCFVTATNVAGTGPASATVSVTSAAPQAISFINPGPQSFGTSPTLPATASSGLDVTFTSATTGVCTITPGGTLTLVSAGTCMIRADQSGSAAFLPAPQVSQSFTVNAVAPGAPIIGTAVAGNSQASVSFTAPSFTGGSAITSYTATCNPGAFAATSPASPITVTGLANGNAYSCFVTATNVAGTGPASATVSVTSAAPQAISFINPGPQSFGTTPTLAATASSGLAVIFTSATPAVCTIATGGALAFVAAGTCTIRADQAGNSAFLPASQVSQTFTVNAVVPGAPVIDTATAGNGQATVSFTAPGFTGGSSITSYTVTCSPGAISATGASSPITVTGLANGTASSCTVAAINGVGTGPASTSVGVTPYAVTSYSGPSATGTGTITASFTGGGATCAYTRSQFIPVAGHATSPPAGSAPPAIVFAHGLFDFATAGCTAGGTITMTITYPQPLLTGTQYWKYGPTPSNAVPHWYVLPATILGNSVVFTITDGGLGDDDLAANGTIADQGGPGVPGAATVVPTLSEWAMIALALLVGAIGMRRMRPA